MKVYPVILCGGSGTRLWPLSRMDLPKQFLSLFGTETLFQQAVKRANRLGCDDITLDEIIIVTNEKHGLYVQDQLRVVKSVKSTLLLESKGRNTAPALTLAAFQALLSDDDPILVVAAADHVVLNQDSFTNALQKCIQMVSSGTILTLGIVPDRAETGYGYIKYRPDTDSKGEYIVDSFIEKPDLKTARQYVDTGEYVWNSGIFVIKANVWLDALNRFRPDILDMTKQAWCGRSTNSSIVRPDEALFSAVPSESIDYAVMEKCPSSDIPVRMIPLNAGWSDLGGWEAFWLIGEKDSDGNVVHGDSIISNTTGSFVYSSKRLIATSGIKDLIVVETEDALLVAKRGDDHSIRELVQSLQKLNRSELTRKS